VLAARREGRIVFVEDESTFSLKPYTTRAWYPRGDAVRVSMTHAPHERFYVFGVMNGRKEHYRFYDGRKTKAMNAIMTLDFLGYLHARYPRVLLFWDKASHHGKSKKVREYAAAHDIRLIDFPTAVPEENPAEQAWNTLAAATANSYYANYEALLAELKRCARSKNLSELPGAEAPGVVAV